jgi:hypothetical protein
VLNSGTAQALDPPHGAGALFTRLLIGSIGSSTYMNGFVGRVRSWVGFTATADLQRMTMPIPVAQIAARGAADGSGRGGVSGLTALVGNARASSYGRAGTPFVTARPDARGTAFSQLRGAITLLGAAISARGQDRSAGLGGSSLGTRNSAWHA